MTGTSCTKHCTNFAYVGDILRRPFGESVRIAEVNNYLAVWGFGGASQPGASQPGPCSGGASQPSAIVVSTRMQAKVGPVCSHNNKVNTQAARIWSILVD